MFSLREVGAIFLAAILGFSGAACMAQVLLRWFGFPGPWWHGAILVLGTSSAAAATPAAGNSTCKVSG
ncbi:hypothetical protein KDX16_28250 [Burkholderia vietnamiensis]|uniref:hypothetical protein n=1 Tax=Burkholderia vietnamiensis TaxID=60552 RepID=UPI001B989044|nr:hypothetical protein [Burkholderia vietnamiensis]MBR7919692.1 hypothetical protein [Burkholderia vietnamiensis]